MAVDNTGLNYCTIESFIKWVSSNLAGMLSNDSVNNFDHEGENQKAIIKEALLHGEGKVNGFLRKRGYKTPIDSSYTSTISVLVIYVYNIAVYELYGRRGVNKERYYKYTRTLETLKDIADGDEHLPDDLPRVSGGKLAHGNSFSAVFSSTKEADKHSL